MHQSRPSYAVLRRTTLTTVKNETDLGYTSAALAPVYKALEARVLQQRKGTRILISVCHSRPSCSGEAMSSYNI